MAAAPNAWFRDAQFNLLIDYYTEVPSRPYGAGATPENIASWLTALEPGFVIVYAKGHSGYTTFRSRLRTEHRMLARDMPAAFREATRASGSRLFLYYSGLVDGIAGLRHPDWCQRGLDGQPAKLFSDFDPLFIGYAACPLSDYFDQWVAVHLAEMAAYEPDGIWVDGDWAGPCYCPRCADRHRAETGYDGPWPPPADRTDPAGLAWARTWAGITHEWRTRFSARVKELLPNCLYSAGNVSPRAEFAGPFDWRSGDWFSPNNHRLQQSIVMRRYTTSDLPYDAMTVDTAFIHPWKHLPARPKSEQRMLQEGAGVLANGGVWCYWTYPMPDGALIPSKLRPARAAAAFARERREVTLDTRSAAWTGVLDLTPFGVLDPGTWGAGKALIELHRSPDLLDETQLTDDPPYELLVVPEQASLDAATVAHLAGFVERGGRLLTTGVSGHAAALQEVLGCRLVRPAALTEGHVIRASGEPTLVAAPWDAFELTTGEELAPLYLSWDQLNPEARHIPRNWPMHGLLDELQPEPAGLPAAIVRRLGAGLAVHVPTSLFGSYWTTGFPEQRAWLRELLATLQPEPWFTCDAPCCVEVALRRREDALIVHLINGNPGRDMSHVGTMDLWVDEVPVLADIRLRVRCAERPRHVRWVPDSGPVEATWADGALAVLLPRLVIHTCLVVEGWRP